MNETRFWVAVASLDYVEQCVRGGYIEINHGQATPLERMAPGDGIACYSPRLVHPAGALLQSFTAVGRIGAAPIMQSPLAHQPFRREVAWLPGRPAPIRPLLAGLGFLANRTHWGVAFRFGFLRIAREDFLRITQAMGCAFRVPPPPALLPADAAPGDPAPGTTVSATGTALATTPASAVATRSTLRRRRPAFRAVPGVEAAA